MHSDNRVISLDGLSPHELAVPPSIIGLGEPAVLCSKPFEKRLDRLRKASIGRGVRRPCRISAGRWDRQESQDSDARRLVFVRDIRVISRGGQTVVPEPVPIFIIRAEIDVVVFKMALDMGTHRLLSSINNDRPPRSECSVNLRGHEGVRNSGQTPFASQSQRP